MTATLDSIRPPTRGGMYGQQPRPPQQQPPGPPGRPQYQRMATTMGGGPAPNPAAAQQPQQPAQQPTMQSNLLPAAQQPQSAVNPYQPAYAPQPTMGQAALSGAQTQLSPEQLQALGPQATIDQILKGFQPQANLAEQNLQNTLAASGIVGGGAQQAQNLLQSNLASALAPTLANAIQTSQGNVLGAEEAGLQGGLQQSLANMGAVNQMTGQNVGNIQQTNLANMMAANQGRSQLAQALQSGWQLPFEAFQQLQTGGLSTGGQLAGIGAQSFAIPQQQSGGLLGALGL